MVCISGGSAFHIARLYKAKVQGIDLSTNMVSMAREYLGKMEESVRKTVSAIRAKKSSNIIESMIVASF